MHNGNELVKICECTRVQHQKNQKQNDYIIEVINLSSNSNYLNLHVFIGPRIVAFIIHEPFTLSHTEERKKNNILCLFLFDICYFFFLLCSILCRLVCKEEKKWRFVHSIFFAFEYDTSIECLKITQPSIFSAGIITIILLYTI